MNLNLAIGHCHGTTNYNPATPECYHPGPGILPVWESDLLAWLVVIAFVLVIWYACRKAGV